MKFFKFILVVISLFSIVFPKRSLRRKAKRGDKKLDALCKKDNECKVGLECSSHFCKKSKGQYCEKDTECASYTCTLENKCMSEFLVGLKNIFSK